MNLIESFCIHQSELNWSVLFDATNGSLSAMEESTTEEINHRFTNIYEREQLA